MAKVVGVSPTKIYAVVRARSVMKVVKLRLA